MSPDARSNECSTGSFSASVILPVYNDQQNLDQCLAALQRQSLATDRFEVIVIDNGSQPAVSLPQAHRLNLSLLQCAKPGSYAARNLGIRWARGKVIAFIDVDCMPHEQWLASGLAAIKAAPGNTLVGGEVLFDMPENPGAVELFQSVRLHGQRNNIEQKKFSVTANLFVRREEVGTIGPFDESLLSGGDREWCRRAVGRHFSIRFSQDAVVTTRYRATLAAAIIQTRRVTGGQYHLEAGMDPGGSATEFDSSADRGGVVAFFRLLRRQELSLYDQARVLGVAVILKLTRMLELLRLKAGFTAERR